MAFFEINFFPADHNTEINVSSKQGTYFEQNNDFLRHVLKEIDFSHDV